MKRIRGLDLGNACAGFTDAEVDELKAIVKTYREASGLIIKLSGWIGSHAGHILKRLPGGVQNRMNDIAEVALRTGYAAAQATQARDGQGMPARIARKAQGERWHKLASSVSGALGGLGGVTTVAADLTATTVIAMRSIQQVAASYGEDITDEAVRVQCLAVFGFAGPLVEDEETETGLFATRMTLTGATLSEMLKKVLPRFGIVVGEKVLAQAAPVLGAAAGAAINPVFVGYYQQMAHVHFRLRRLEADHDPQRVRACFERIAATSAR